jgi:hypothetical protein
MSTFFISKQEMVPYVDKEPLAPPLSLFELPNLLSSLTVCERGPDYVEKLEMEGNSVLC